MSAHTEKKARQLVDSGSVARVADNVYQVMSSRAGESYIIDETMECTCLGYRFRQDCSHIQAVGMLRKLEAEAAGAR